MKQKYSITVADMQLNIISDASPDEVENIVGMLDRRMRDINLKSPRCTKNEAAILCALSYCSERITMQEAFKKVEKDAFRYASENEKLKKNIESMQEELDNLRKDVSVMRSILDRATLVEAPKEESKPKYVPTPFTKEPAEELQATEDEQTAPVEQEPPVQEEETPAVEIDDKKTNKSAAKSRIGNMFDLLTFSDV